MAPKGKQQPSALPADPQASLAQVAGEPQGSVQPQGNEQPPADIGPYHGDEKLNTVGVDDSVEVKAVKESPWTVVEELSDDEFQVEVANLDGYQFRMSLLRYRINGQLSPVVTTLDRVRYHAEKGFQNR